MKLIQVLFQAFLGWLTVLITLMLFGCGSSHQQLSQPPPKEKISPPGESLLTYQFVSSFALKSCADCHAGSKEPNLSTLDLVIKNLDKVLSEVDDNSMPRVELGYQSLDTCQKAVLHRWADLGAKEQSTVSVSSIAECKNNVVSPAPAEPDLQNAELTYDTLYARILRPKCAACHAEGSESDAADLPVFPKESFFSHRTWFKPDRTGQLKLLHSVARTDRRRMPPLPDPKDKASKDNGLLVSEIGYLTRFIANAMPQMPEPQKPPQPGGDPNVPLKDLPLSYENLYYRILQPKCISCHWEGGSSGAADLAVYPFERFSSLKTWFQEDEDSPDHLTKLELSVTRTDKDRMPPKPKPDDQSRKDDPLTAEEVNYLSRWIKAGLPK